MITVDAVLKVSKSYPEVGISLPVDSEETISMDCTVETISISDNQLNFRYSAVIQGERCKEILALTCAYDKSQDLMAQAEEAIRTKYE